MGDNEVGKSSILEAIDLVAGGNVRRVESIGLDRLINIDAVKKFHSGRRTFENLPVLRIELYLSGDNLILQCAAKITQTKQSVTGFVWCANQIQITERR